MNDHTAGEAYAYQSAMKKGHKVRDNHADPQKVFDNAEQLMFGLVDGMSFLITRSCLNSIDLAIKNGFDAVQFREI